MSIDPADEIAANLLVLIEGIADHKMDPYHQKALARELGAGIVALCTPAPPPTRGSVMTNHHLRLEILEELDGVVCTKHPPDWDIDNKADAIIEIAEKYLADPPPSPESAAAIRDFLEWCRQQGWTLVAHNGFNSYIPAALYTLELNTSGGSSLDVGKAVKAYLDGTEQNN